MLALLGLVLGTGDPSEQRSNRDSNPLDSLEYANSTAYLYLLKYAQANKGAACLDGSPGAFYFRKGVEAGRNKWLIHHQMGGWCESYKDCAHRSHQATGSSKSYPKTALLYTDYYSAEPAINPMMYNWNIVFLMYCDGGFFSGDRTEVEQHFGQRLHFRGARIRQAAYASLVLNFGLRNASDVVVSGCSAGGLATYLHVDNYCRALALDAPKARCVGLVDSGFFREYEAKTPPTAWAHKLVGRDKSFSTYYSGLVWAFHAFNMTASVNRRCLATQQKLDEQPLHRCVFASIAALYARTPIFTLQSAFDSWQLMRVYDPAEPIEQFGADLGRAVTRVLSVHGRNGLFLASCPFHCVAWTEVRIDGERACDAFSAWYGSLTAAVVNGSIIAARRWWVQPREPLSCGGCCTQEGLAVLANASRRR